MAGAVESPLGGVAEPGGPTPARIGAALKWAGLGQVLSQAASYAMVLVLASLLPPRAFGTVAIGVTMIRLASLLATSGVGGSMIAATHVTRRDVRLAVWRNSAIGLALAGAIAALAAPVVHNFARGADVDAVRVMALAVLFACLGTVPEAILRKTLAFKRDAAVTSVVAVLTAVSAITAAFLGAGVWALVVRQVGFEAFTAAVAWIAARRVIGDVLTDDRPRESHARTVQSGRFAFTVVAASFMAGFVMDNAVVGAATDARQLGYYAFAFTLGFAPYTQFGSQLGQVLFPAAAATADAAVVARRTVKAARLALLVTGPLVPVAVVLGPTLIPSVFGERWAPSVAPFQIFLVIGVGHAVVNTIGSALAGTGYMRRRAPVEALWALATLAAIYVAVRYDGVRGAALGRLLIFVPLVSWYVFRGTRLLESSASDLWNGVRDVLVPVLVQSLLTALIYLVLVQAKLGATAAAVAAAVVGLSACLAAMHATRSRPLQEAKAVLKLVGVGR